MKMSPLLMIAAALSITTLNTSCIKADAAAHTEHEAAPENGAKFKKGEGVSLTDEMKQAIGLQIADVGEEKVAATLTLNLDATKTTEASGWISPQQASLVKPGASVELQAEGQSAVIKGIVRGVVPMLLGTLGDCQMTVITDQPLVVGTRMKGTLRASAGDAVAAVPRSALLRTAEGTFVYAVNGAFYVRTPVKTGAMNDALVEITDGLYSGDQIVTSSVMSLWMAELQVLRGGKACTCGH